MKTKNEYSIKQAIDLLRTSKSFIEIDIFSQILQI